MTYVYSDSTAVVGPLATHAEPHSYDLCITHAMSLTAPQGWDVVRPDAEIEAAAPSGDDLEALANAVREAARPRERTDEPTERGIGRRGHLRVVPNPD